MASKGPRSKLDHETRARRQKALEAPREPRRPKAHWDHVLSEMVWLAKEFESERKWKLSIAKKIAQRANKSLVDQATKGERKQKKFSYIVLVWGKQVVYKHQLELEERKKKALDKQLDFLLGQTERYSTMLAENLVDMPYSQNLENGTLQINQSSRPEEVAEENINEAIPDDPDNMEVDGDYESSLDEEPEDDEHTIDEDEAQITEAERNEELAALQAEADLPLDDILKMYTVTEDSSNQANGRDHEPSHSSTDDGFSEEEDDGRSYAEFVKKNHVTCSLHLICALEDKDYVAADEGKDDEATLSEEEELAKKEVPDHLEEIKLLQKESEIPLEELLAMYQKDGYADHEITESENSPCLVEETNTELTLDDQSADILEENSGTVVDHLSADVLKTEHNASDVEAAIRQAEDEADYMALKKLEQEEAVDNQEFSEEVAGRPEDDELVNEEDVKLDEHINEEHRYNSSDVEKEKNVALSVNQLNEEKALTLAVGDEDTDMLADVKQMAAAAAAAGQASSSFENQLRPIDRYAMRFMELWDPVIDKASINHQVNVEEEEWELDRIEKLKEDLEAEIDEDQEPLSYESWDVDFATTAYRQHVEALTQKQLLEEQERQAREAAKELEEKNDNTRLASEACNEGEGSHWASSAFHINDATKHKCGPKSIGKHKAASECGRPPKSKIQKITESHQEGPIASSNFLRMPGPLLPGSTDFHISESLSDFGISDSEFNYSEDIWQEGDYLEFLPDQDDSELPGIEELEPLSDFTDIG
nr:unnamed protein product [Digitaria exilis]